MAFIQRVTPQPNKVLTFSLKNFVGGLNNRSDVLKPNEASDLINMRFADDTVMEKRFGTTTYDDFTADGPITFIDEFKPYNDSNQLIRATDESVYLGTTKLTDVAGRVHGANYSGYYFIFDGTKIRCYGKYAQTADDYNVIDGTPNPDYVLMEVVDPPTGYTPLDNTHTQGVTHVDYTNSKVWYEPCAQELADANKAGNVIPKSPKYAVVRGGRLYVSGVTTDNDNVFLSDLQNPFYFPAALPLQVPPNSDAIVGMVEYDDGVVVGRQNDIYVIHGETNRTDVGLEVFNITKLNTHTGVANQNAMSVVNNDMFFLGSDGVVYALSNTRLAARTLATTIVSQQLDLTKDPIGWTLADIRDGASMYWQDEWLLSVKDKILVFNYRIGAWTMYNNINIHAFYVTMDNQFTFSNDKGQILKWSTDYLDLGQPFQAFWKSMYFDMNDANSYKQFKEFFIVAHTFEQFPSTIHVDFDIDYDNVNADIQIKNQISVWGRARFGDRFITANINASSSVVIGRRGRTIRFTLSNGWFPSAPVATKSDLGGYPNLKDGTLVYVQDESTYYLYDNSSWSVVNNDDLNQTMRIYQVNGDYEMRGKW